MAGVAGAQNINPTVQVTNTYEGKLMDIQKVTPKMAVPDSVLKFDWNFDYSVFENPYKGAYEFSPYLMSFRPEERISGGKSLYVRAGIGYSLHPELTAVWSPKFKKFPIRMTVYDDFKGFAGNHHVFSPVIEDRVLTTAKDTSAFGYDLTNRLGAVARYSNSHFATSLDLGYDIIATGKQQEFLVAPNSTLTNSFDVTAYGKSLMDWPFGLEGSVAYSTARQRVHYADFSSFGDYNVDALVKATYGWRDFVFGVDVEAELGRMASIAEGQREPLIKYGLYSFAPKTDWRHENLHVSGALDIVARTGGLTHGQHVFPTVDVEYTLVPELFTVFAGYHSGSDIVTLTDFAKKHHFASVYQSLPGYGYNAVDNDFESMNILVGASGRYSSHLQASIDAGFAKYENALMDGFCYQRKVGAVQVSAPMYYRTNYDVLYMDASAEWKSDRIYAKADMRLQDSSVKEKQAENVGGYLLLPMFKGSAEFNYNWNKRIYAGVTVEGQTARKFAQECPLYDAIKVPGWVDLGVNAEFKATQKLSVWAKGGNLLCQTIQRDVFYAEKGLYFTLGVCLNF